MYCQEIGSKSQDLLAASLVIAGAGGEEQGGGQFFRVRNILVLISLVLAGCVGSLAGNDANIYPLGLFGQNVVGNEIYVTVSNVYNEMDALPLADAHCAKFGKSARFNHMERIRAIFDCVPRQR